MTLVKICGLKDSESAQVAIDSSANLLGMILVPNRSRTIELEEAKKIIYQVNQNRNSTHQEIQRSFAEFDRDGDQWTEQVVSLIKERGPLTVGVFRNQSIEEINNLYELLKFDIIQLHGKEPRQEYIKNLKGPVITRFLPNDEELHKINASEQVLSLFDSENGGEGLVLNWDKLNEFGQSTNSKFILAGGLTPENVSNALKVNGVIGVDVSGGVETSGVKDHEKIKKFIKNIRSTEI